MIKIIISLTPSLLFLSCLQVLDSYKLVKVKTVALLLLLGSIAAVVAYFININLISFLNINVHHYSIFIAPIIEEILKASFIIYFLLKKRVAFLVDGAIFGFSVGVGFAILENIYYLNNLGEVHLLIWILRGFGTSIMHGCTTAIYSIIIKYSSERFSKINLTLIPILLIVPVIIHCAFNSFIISPIAFTIIQLTVTPLLFYIVFLFSETQLKGWLELSLESNYELLAAINEGTLLETKVGVYLQSLKISFSSLVLVDLICYIRLYIELSMLAKGLLIMKEVGIHNAIIEEIKSKLDEIKYLEKKIGITGKMAIQPIVYNEKGIVWINKLLEDVRTK